MYPMVNILAANTSADTLGKDTKDISNGFQCIVPTSEQKKEIDIAYKKLQIVRRTKSQVRNIDQATAYIFRMINFTVTTRVCTEYRNFFWFSRLDRAGLDDQTFKSGFAIRRGTGDIYRWEEK